MERLSHAHGDSVGTARTTSCQNPREGRLDDDQRKPAWPARPAPHAAKRPAFMARVGRSAMAERNISP